MLCKLIQTISELGTGRDGAGRRVCKNSDFIHTSVLECETPYWNLS
jgi:hypothetical protein